MVIKTSKYKPESEMTALDKIDKQMEIIKTHRLTDEEIERAKYCFGTEGHRENILWYLYNREASAKDVDKAFGFPYNTTNGARWSKPEYFKKVGRIGHKFVFTASQAGRELVEEIIRRY